MLESSQRVEQLADLFRRRVEPLPDPGPPQSLPGKPRTASVPIQIVAIILYDHNIKSLQIQIQKKVLIFCNFH